MPSVNLDLEQTTPIAVLEQFNSTKKQSVIQIVKTRSRETKLKNPKKEKIQKFIKTHLPISQWIGFYNVAWGLNDLIAGITLGLTIIPESMACALLAGLPAHYGLCSAFLGSFIYLIFGTIPKVIMGPTSLVALVSVQFTVGKPIEFAVLLTFFSGVVQIILGLLQMGFIFEFISLPVVKAFSSATAVLVIESQLKVLLGIKYLAAGCLQSLRTLATRLDEANDGDLLVGLSAIALLIALDQLAKLSQRCNWPKCQQTFFLYLSFLRNTLVVLLTAGVTYFWFHNEGTAPYALSKNSLSGLPNFSWPKLTAKSDERYYTIWDILKELNVGIIVVPIIGILTNFSIAKISNKNEANSNQELVTVGICNVFGSCVQSMPTSGAFSRCAISTACGLCTPMANLYTGIIVLLALSFISPYFNLIPEATLAAILICSIYTLIDFRLPRRLWHESRREFYIWLICFIASIIFGVEVGLCVSICITLLHLIFVWARPQVDVQIEELSTVQYLRIIPATAVYFPATAYLSAKIRKLCSQIENSASILVIDCGKVFDLDYTGAQGLMKLAHELSDVNRPASYFVIFYHLDDKLQKFIQPSDKISICNREDALHQLILLSCQRRNDDDVNDQSINTDLLHEQKFKFQIDTEDD